MSFGDIMRRMVDAVPGATACCVMGFDGIAVETFSLAGPALDVPAILVEFTAPAVQLWRTAVAPAGRVGELTLACHRLVVVLRPLNEDYFVALLLAPHGLLGKARYVMRQEAPVLLKEIVA